ncbi:MAG: hypothetical protein OJI67_21715, partial [Prosthecobacter sp.]|nr:hypothetical protein [Prosthecobacter sp.]
VKIVKSPNPWTIARVWRPTARSIKQYPHAPKLIVQRLGEDFFELSPYKTDSSSPPDIRPSLRMNGKQPCIVQFGEK